MEQECNKKLTISQRYLMIIGLALIAMGIYVSLLNNSFVFTLLGNLINPVFWPDGLTTEGTHNFKGFIYSFSGTYVLIWGINFFFISRYALVRGNKWAWNCLALSTIIWFIIMEPFSIYYKVYYNAIGDVLFFIIIAIPMIKIRKYIYA